MQIDIQLPDGSHRSESLLLGDILRIDVDVSEKAQVTVMPNKNCDVGEGPGQRLETEVEGGVAGIFFDARGRPLQLPDDHDAMKKLLLNWFTALNVYPTKDKRHIGDM
jgi:hypothetical protein